MNAFETFRVNSPTVVHEIFEQEVVIIHLDSGNYYTLNESGARIWALLMQESPLSLIITALTAEYTADAAVIADAVNQIIEQLQKAQLIIPASTKEDNTAAGPLSGNHITAKHTAAFPEPLLTKYTDMQDLLLLDPIHEVEDTGWPNGKRR